MKRYFLYLLIVFVIFVISCNTKTKYDMREQESDLFYNRVSNPEYFDNSTLDSICNSRKIALNSSDDVSSIGITTYMSIPIQEKIAKDIPTFPHTFIVNNKEMIDEIILRLKDIEFNDKNQGNRDNSPYSQILDIYLREKLDGEINTKFSFFDNGEIELSDATYILSSMEYPTIGTAVDENAIKDIIEKYLNSIEFDGKNIKEWDFRTVRYTEEGYFKCEYAEYSNMYGEIKYFDKNGNQIYIDEEEYKNVG